MAAAPNYIFSCLRFRKTLIQTTCIPKILTMKLAVSFFRCKIKPGHFIFTVLFELVIAK